MVMGPQQREEIERIYEHAHSVGFVRPTGAAPVTLTSGVGAWTLSAFSADLIAAADITLPFDLHEIVLSNASNNATFEIVLYGTVNGVADVELDRVRFTRLGATVQSIPQLLHTPMIDPGSRIRCKTMDSTGALTIDVVCIKGHRY